MNRNFGLILAVMFLAMQVFSLLHMAGHGFAKHMHNGHLCEICIIGEQKNIAGTVPQYVIEPLDYILTKNFLFQATIYLVKKEVVAAPRAPPVILLS